LDNPALPPKAHPKTTHINKLLAYVAARQHCDENTT